MKWLPLLLLLSTNVVAASLPNYNNDDTCDVKVGPAATLLLPYFEVDVADNSGQTTLFTVTNVTRYPQIAHVTLWTDRAFPLLTFNLYLTGYDVQSINLADVLIRGVVASPNGASSTATPGPLSSPGSANLVTPLNCANNPGVIPAALMSIVRSALREGNFSGLGTACSGVGNVHSNAIGYATIDVAANCTSRLPSEANYYTNDILFDNVLIGDYQHLGPHEAGQIATSFDGAGNPMVHIRAVPEGGGAGSNVATGLPFTFYDRYTPATARTLDRRQPLPATFAARFIQGGPNAFATNLNIWREAGGASCADAVQLAAMPTAEIVRFDEHENVFIEPTGINCLGCSFPQFTLPATSSSSVANSSIYPLLTNGDVGGWIYLNLNNGGNKSYSVTHDIGGQPGPTNARTSLAPIGSTTTTGPRPSQNWVTVTMFGHVGNNRLSAEFDAASLGNGCSPAAFLTTADGGGLPIGPAGGVFVCPPGPTLTNGTTAQCVGTNVNPTP
ncbi:MAG: hypothetical protein QOC81_5067 [Thermoanaerobaculia bacterium]|jgi:hypothetical protein|nr:hypothetical protein [Thermoanaerobaculia bacterium]